MDQVSINATRKSIGNTVMAAATVLLIGGMLLNAPQLLRGSSNAPAAVRPSVEIGTAVSSIKAVDDDEKPIEVRLNGGTPTLIYYFSPVCAWCERNWANIEAIASASGGRYRVLGLTTVPHLKPFLDARSVNFEVYSGLEPGIRAQLKLTSTPATILVGGDGKVEGVWSGAYTGPTAKELAKRFSVRLPGLDPPEKYAGR